MCTLIAFHRVWDDAPLVIAANRDERYDRPARGPEWLADPPALAPRDEAAGGTWMGANVAGVWVGITNRRGNRPADPTRRSRGLLCLDLLRSRSVAEVVAAIETADERYNPFHVVCGDGSALVLVEYEEGRIAARELEPGLHVVTNEPFDAAVREPKALRVRMLLESGVGWRSPAAAPPVPSAAMPQELIEGLAGILADHGLHGADAICLHGGRYGTRSSAVWRIHARSPRRRQPFDLVYADGPPCSTPFASIPLPEMGSTLFNALAPGPTTRAS